MPEIFDRSTVRPLIHMSPPVFASSRPSLGTPADVNVLPSSVYSNRVHRLELEECRWLHEIEMLLFSGVATWNITPRVPLPVPFVGNVPTDQARLRGSSPSLSAGDPTGKVCVTGPTSDAVPAPSATVVVPAAPLNVHRATISPADARIGTAATPAYAASASARLPAVFQPRRPAIHARTTAHHLRDRSFITLTLPHQGPDGSMRRIASAGRPCPPRAAGQTRPAQHWIHPSGT